MKNFKIFCSFLVLFLPACSGFGAKNIALATKAGWHWRMIETSNLPVASASAAKTSVDTLWVYLEGDGRAYLSPSRPSSDPTPTEAVALHMALLDPIPEHAVYLARPCQFYSKTQLSFCDVNDWTLGRYSERILYSLNQALDLVKKERQAKHLVLVGYSGGGSLAVLLAAHRKDVVRMITVAGNLDTDIWVKQNKLTPLRNSLNPANYVSSVRHIPQIHFRGEDDTTIGLKSYQSYRNKLYGSKDSYFITLPDFTHQCCWGQEWPLLYELSIKR